MRQILVGESNKKYHSNSVYIPYYWSQLNGNVGNVTISNYNSQYGRYGIVGTQGWTTLGNTADLNGITPGITSNYPYPYGLFYSNGSTSTTHVTLTPTSDANISSDAKLGVWLRTTN